MKKSSIILNSQMLLLKQSSLKPLKYVIMYWRMIILLGFAIFMAWPLNIILRQYTGSLQQELIDHTNLLYPILFICIGMVLINLRDHKNLRNYKLNLILSLLYGQCAFSFSLIIAENLYDFIKAENINVFMTSWRIIHLIAAIFFSAELINRNRPNIIAIFSIIYMFFSLDGIGIFLVNIEFIRFYHIYSFLIYSLGFPIIFLAISVLGFYIAQNRFRTMYYSLEEKKKRLLNIICCYSGASIIFLVLTFAHIYNVSADISYGRAFDYNMPAIKLQLENRIAKAFPNLPGRIYTNIVNEILENKDHHIGTMVDYTFKSETNPYTVFYFCEHKPVIGSAWADFYVQLFVQDKITHARLVRHKKTSSSNGSKLYKLLLYRIPCNRYDEDYPTITDCNTPYIELYDKNKHGLPVSEYLVYLPAKMHAYKATSPDPPIEFDKLEGELVNINIYTNCVFNMLSLYNYLSGCKNYLDEKPIIIKQIIENDWPSSYLDYIYFSIITLSTTGYGDIAPIHPFLQILCIIEIGLGWSLLIILGNALIKKIVNN